jgi:O-antigen ligase
MGRFLNSRAVAAAPDGLTTIEPRVLFPNTAAETANDEPASIVATPVSVPVQTSPATIVGLYSLCIYLIGGYATDLSYRFLGTKPYVTVVTGILVFICFLMSGRALAALRTGVGKLWLGMGIWMCMSVLFSNWRGGSLAILQVYIPKQHMVLFYIAAFVLTIEQCRTLLRAFILGGCVLILTCFFFGAPELESGRFAIPTNWYLSNPNDLAMQLLLCLGFFIFLIRQPGLFGRIGGVLGLLGAAYYLLATGSRGGMLAATVLALLCVLFSANRVRILILALPVLLLMIAVLPRGTLSRLSLIGVTPTTHSSTNMEEAKAIDSAVEREHLLIASVKYALKNPLFGLGPGCFADAIWEDGKKEGRHEASMGTHNTYTQIAAECGIPALIMFVGAVFLTIRSSFRLYRATNKDPSHSLVAAIAFTCFAMGIAFSIDLFFHHMAYSGNMAMVLGLWVATDLAARHAGIGTTTAAA